MREYRVGYVQRILGRYTNILYYYCYYAYTRKAIRALNVHVSTRLQSTSHPGSIIIHNY